jgi:Tfp pilus assembly protein PilF
MDGRTVGGLTALIVGLGLTGSSIGCIQTANNANVPGTPPVPITKPAETKKRLPKAGTYVAWAAVLEQKADTTTDVSQKQNTYDEARQLFQQALKADPKHMPAYTGLARIYVKMGHNERALETYRKALEKNPNDADLWFQIGVCECRQRHWDLAVLAFQKALELAPENRRLTQTLGFCLACADRLDESVAVLSEIMKPAEANLTMGRILLRLNKPDQSRTFLAKALQLDPSLDAAQEMLARLENPQTPPTTNSVVQIGFEE